jgi:NADH-quinone oxidoreductase subunit L
MEAPVPASALIHSATLVSAGVYLILRFKSILLLSEYATVALPVIGAITACLGAVSSAFQTDAKKLLAYSTISHCGFLVVSAIMCDSEYTILYLYVHGFFKAASFICIGNIIRFNCGSQDIRFMGGYAKFLPFECFSLFVCLLFLAGAPFTFGFFMKHFLLASVPTIGFFYKFITVLLFSAACFGVVYCSRLYYGIFYGVKKSNKHVYVSVSKSSYYRFDTDGTFYTNATIAAAFAISGLMLSGLCIC